MRWREFWSPEDKGYGLFFLKFFIFSVMAFGVWSVIKTPYNHLLRTMSLSIVRSSELPVMAHRFKEERGTLEIQFRPYLDGPVAPKQKKSVVVRIFFNTLHFNIIPFLALLAASPVRSFRRLLGFFLVGCAVLFLSHLLHIYLNFKSYYFKQQEFVLKPLEMSPEQLKAAASFFWRLKVLSTFQGFMEQAGSMIMPAFIWMIYASQWIFRSILGTLVPVPRREVPSGKGNDGKPAS